MRRDLGSHLCREQYGRKAHETHRPAHGRAPPPSLGDCSNAFRAGLATKPEEVEEAWYRAVKAAALDEHDDSVST